MLHQWMKYAFEEADIAMRQGEVPIGAVFVLHTSKPHVSSPGPAPPGSTPLRTVFSYPDEIGLVISQEWNQVDFEKVHFLCIVFSWLSHSFHSFRAKWLLAVTT